MSESVYIGRYAGALGLRVIPLDRFKGSSGAVPEPYSDTRSVLILRPCGLRLLLFPDKKRICANSSRVRRYMAESGLAINID